MPLRSTSMSVPRYLLFKNELANKSLVPQNSLLPQTNHTHEQGLCYALQIPCRASPYTVHDAVFSQQFLLTMCPFLESLASKSHGLRSYRRQKLYTAETEYNSSLAVLYTRHSSLRPFSQLHFVPIAAPRSVRFLRLCFSLAFPLPLP
jgi:hypothetical protein